MDKRSASTERACEGAQTLRLSTLRKSLFSQIEALAETMTKAH
jgi:hypothetical protein